MAKAKSTIAHTALRPYQSYHVFKSARANGDWEKFLRTLVNETFSLKDGLDGEFTLLHGPTVGQFPESKDGLQLAWMTYTKAVTPAWTDDEAGLLDIENHILLVATAFKYVAISTSDKSLAGRLDRLKAQTKSAPTLSNLPRVEPSTLESALIHGNARILWMSAIHRDMAIRPNAKVLIGTNLEAALDPLSDQTFHYTSVRSDGPKDVGGNAAFGRAAPGVSPRKGRVWLARSHKFHDFTARTRTLLELLSLTRTTKAPFPILARPIDDLSEVRDAFDFVLLPPESETDPDDTIKEQHELATSLPWVVRGNKASSEATFSAPIGKITYEIVVTISADDASAAITKPKNLAAKSVPPAIAAARERFVSEALKIYYDSGHTYSGGAVYGMPTRLLPFEQFEARSFANINICEEKPTKQSTTNPKKYVADLDKIGTSGEKSLFSWTFHQYGPKSWLWCDDGAGEIADFIHISTNDEVTLLHLKAAGNLEGEVSVGKYEVVCAQALKNIRMLEAEELLARLKKKVADPSAHARCWFNRQPKPETAFVKRVEKIKPSNRVPRVVVVQPHVSRSKLPTALGPTTQRRVMQLHTMLNGFAANFRNLGIEFTVIVKK